jgi:hypothetical protein
MLTSCILTGCGPDGLALIPDRVHNGDHELFPQSKVDTKWNWSLIFNQVPSVTLQLKSLILNNLETVMEIGQQYSQDLLKMISSSVFRHVTDVRIGIKN